MPNILYIEKHEKFLNCIKIDDYRNWEGHTDMEVEQLFRFVYLDPY